MPALPEAEADSLNRSNVAIFPLSDFEWFLGHIGRRPLYAIALRFHSTWINVENLVFSNVNQQIALPQLHQQHTALGSVINIPRSRSFIIKAHDGEGDRFPFNGLAGLGGLRPHRVRKECDYQRKEHSREGYLRSGIIKARRRLMRRALYAMVSAIFLVIRESG